MSSLEGHDDCTLLEARLLKRGKPRLVTIKSMYAGPCDEGLSTCLASVGMRRLTADEIGQERRRLSFYRPILLASSSAKIEDHANE